MKVYKCGVKMYIGCEEDCELFYEQTVLLLFEEKRKQEIR